MNITRAESQIRQAQKNIDAIIGLAQDQGVSLTRGELDQIGKLDNGIKRLQSEILTA